MAEDIKSDFTKAKEKDIGSNTNISLEDNKNQYLITTINETYKKVNELETKNTELEKKLESSIEDVNKLKIQIFSIMGLFFAVFSFISVDLSFSKALFDFENYNEWMVLGIFIVSQVIFGSFIYYFTMKIIDKLRS